MSRELWVVWAGRRQRAEIASLCDDYRQRIARVVPIRDVPIRIKGSPPQRVRRREEGRTLLAALPPRRFAIALDARGRRVTSEDIRRTLVDRLESAPDPIVFLVGSDVGLDDAVTAGADALWSLGPLTLAHAIARLVLYEQLFRAVASIQGIQYDRGPF